MSHVLVNRVETDTNAIVEKIEVATRALRNIIDATLHMLRKPDYWINVDFNIELSPTLGRSIQVTYSTYKTFLYGRELSNKVEVESIDAVGEKRFVLKALFDEDRSETIVYDSQYLDLITVDKLLEDELIKSSQVSPKYYAELIKSMYIFGHDDLITKTLSVSRKYSRLFEEQYSKISSESIKILERLTEHARKHGVSINSVFFRLADDMTTCYIEYCIEIKARDRLESLYALYADSIYLFNERLGIMENVIALTDKEIFKPRRFSSSEEVYEFYESFMNTSVERVKTLAYVFGRFVEVFSKHVEEFRRKYRSEEFDKNDLKKILDEIVFSNQRLREKIVSGFNEIIRTIDLGKQSVELEAYMSTVDHKYNVKFELNTLRDSHANLYIKAYSGGEIEVVIEYDVHNVNVNVSYHGHIYSDDVALLYGIVKAIEEFLPEIIDCVKKLYVIYTTRVRRV